MIQMVDISEKNTFIMPQSGGHYSTRILQQLERLGILQDDPQF